MMEKGMIYLSDICNMQRKEMLTVNEISQKFQVHPMIAYVIRHAVPASWGQRIRNMRGSDNLELIERLKESPKSAKWAYS